MYSPQFADLQIRILEPRESGRSLTDTEAADPKLVYPVEITLNGALEFESGKLDAAAIAQWQPAADSACSGSNLFNLLLDDQKLKSAWDQVQAMYPRRRIRLRVDFAAPEINAIPWELMSYKRMRADNGDGNITALAASFETPFARYQADKRPAPPPLIERPIKMLVAIANPQNLHEYGLDPVDVETEMALLEQATANLDIQITRLQNCTVENLMRELRNGYHILHFVGHGAYSEKVDESVIFMADADNNVRLISERFEAALIARQYATDASASNPLRLIFLASCHTAPGQDSVDGDDAKARRERASPGNAFRGFAPKLVSAGVPAVIAMQDLVPVETARVFAATFYQRLLEHGLVDLACNEARQAVDAARLSGAHIPALYTRIDNGQLLASDPIYATIEAMLAHEDYQFFAPENKKYLDLPIEVTHMELCEEEITDSAWRNIHAFATMQLETTAGLEIHPLMNGLFSGEIPHRTQHEFKSKLLLLVGDYGSSKSTQLRYLAWRALKDAQEFSKGVAQKADASERRGKISPFVRSDTIVLPVYIDLRHYADIVTELSSPSEMAQMVERLILRALDPYWPGLNGAELQRQMQKRRFRFLFAKGEYLSNRLRAEVLRRINEFIRVQEHLNDPEQLGHEYVITLSPAQFKQALVQRFVQEPQLEVHLLVIQRLRVGKIRHFLSQLINNSSETGYAQKLLDRLDDSGLYDLAAIPWFFVDMIHRVRAGEMPQSRVQLLDNEIEDAIARMGNHQGIQTYAVAALYACAWKLISEMRDTLTISEVFGILGQIRGNRDFPLEDFYNKLIATRLLTRIDNGEIRFTYDRVCAFCCACALVNKLDRQRQLDNIVAAFGRLSHLNWWQDVIVYVCGILAQQGELKELISLLQSIAYGANLLENEQIFLAAQCLLESLTVTEKGSSETFHQHPDLDALRGHVNGALLWRLNKRNEPSSSYRDRAAALLGYLAPPPAKDGSDDGSRLSAMLLAKTALEPQSGNDIGNMLFAAVVSFLRMSDPEQQEQFLATLDPELAIMLNYWRNAEVEPLIKQFKMTAQNGRNIRGVAAIVLADIYGRLSTTLSAQKSRASVKAQDAEILAECQKNLELILHELTEAFFETTNRMVLWSITFGLANIDTMVVMEHVVKPYEEEIERRQLAPADRDRHRTYLTYLLGLLRAPGPTSQKHLLRNLELPQRTTLDEYVELMLETLNAFSRLADPQYKSLLEQMAVGKIAQAVPGFGDIQQELSTNLEAFRAWVGVQRAAIDALANLGDEKTVNVLRRLREEITWKTLTITDNQRLPFYETQLTIYRELNLAIDRTADHIYWRMNWRR